MASSSPPAGATMPPSLSPALKELHTNILDLIRSVTPAAGPTGSFLLMDDSESDADAVPLDGLWSQALTLASTTLDPSTDLPLLPLVLAQCVSHAALPPNYALDPHFYLLAATVTDLDAAHTVLSLMDLPAAVNNPGVLLPDAWVPLWPRMVVDVVLRSARWHRLPVDADAVTMEMPLLVLAFATARMARLSDPACYVDDATIRQLLTALHASRTHHHLEPLHDALAQLLLAINDQSLAWPLPPLDPDAGPPLPMNTPLLRAICHSPPTSSSSPTSPACTPPPTSSPSSARPALSSPAAHSFTETLVFLLNRAAHAANQLLVLKPVYVILAVRPDLFYTNDVRVLIQVVLRVLLDDECTPSVRNALLRVLEVGVPNVKRVGMGEEVKRVVGCVGEWVRVGKVRDDVGGTTGRVVARVLDVLGEE